MAEVRLHQVSKRFGTVQAVRGLDLHIQAGEFLVMLGPSGAGKTTTLRLVAGLERPDRGQVFIGGQDVTGQPPAARDVTFVFQQYSLYPHLSVYDNLAFPLRSPLRRVPEAQIADKVRQVAQLLRIEDKLRNPATRLSGGQMQRVAIGRALVRNPAVTLMDEPLSSLDAKLRDDLRLELKRIQQDLGATVLYVTHDQTEALTLASRVAVLEAGEIVQVGTPREIYEDPVSVHVASRLGLPRINLVPCAVWPGCQAPPTAVTLGVRPEHLDLEAGPQATGAPGRVRRLETLSDRALAQVVLEAGDQEIVVALAGGRRFEPGQEVRVRWRRVLWFDAQARRVRQAPAGHEQREIA